MKSTKDKSAAYTSSGVNIDAADAAKKLIKKTVRSTFGPEVLTDIGLFGALYEFKGYKNPVLVSSTDGVGTKLRIAVLMGKYDTVGIDLVNHCINDILCCGAAPLFFLDYIAAGKLVPERMAKIVEGLAKACKASGCALIGGETAEMPGIYQGDDFDLAGFIVGVVGKHSLITGKNVKENDIILGLPSSGLHTNGYSLARKVFDIENNPKVLKKSFGLKRTLGEMLLEPHVCYFPQLKPFLKKIKAMAHITGGGFTGNLPRVLPKGLGAVIKKGSWKVPEIFNLIQEKGKIDDTEMHRVFNMGVGMTVVCAPADSARMKKALGASIIGKIVKSKNSDILFS
ncbi:MAG: phosphoribosylformylglycinamidine cyclo-ligase [Chloroflexi bacterium RBG_16_48_7]|nr:MAG: phosphoribosylformylglycinamidine cyclo-ligase [Chloroflexi bacterium RBG_16_48_7]